MASRSIECPRCGDKLPLKLNEDGDLQAVCSCIGRTEIVAVVCKPGEKKTAVETAKKDDKE